MKQLPWILCVIFLAFILLQSVVCNKPAGDFVPRNQFNALQQRLNDTSAAYSRYRQWADPALENATVSAMQANERADSSLNELENSRIYNVLLLARLDSVDKEKPDSTWITVSPRYREGCEDLRRSNLTLNYWIVKYERDAQIQATMLQNANKLRDSMIDRERAFSSAFRQLANTSITTGKQLEKATRQKYQLWGGAAAWGSQLRPLGGGEINLSLKTPRDQMYEVKGAYMLKTWWVGIGAKVKFHF